VLFKIAPAVKFSSETKPILSFKNWIFQPHSPFGNGATRIRTHVEVDPGIGLLGHLPFPRASGGKGRGHFDLHPPRRLVPRLNLVQTADALTGAAAGPLAVSALSISSIVRPRVSKPMNRTATSARTYQAAK
jgi:hypothetical protein